MTSNSRKDKVLAVLILMSFIAWALYLSKIYIPGYIYHIANEQGVARVVDRKELNGNKVIVYTYYHEYLGKNITNERRVWDLKKWELYRSKKVFDITYAKILSSYVVFESIDTTPLLFLTIFPFVVSIFGIWSCIKVLRDKVTLADLLGVRR